MDDECGCIVVSAVILVPCWVGWGFWVARVGIGGDWTIILTAVYLLMFTVVWLPPLVILALVVGVGYGIFLLLEAAISWLIHHPHASIGILVTLILLGVLGALGEWLESRSSRPRSRDPEASAERSVYSPLLPRPGGPGAPQPPRRPRPLEPPPAATNGCPLCEKCDAIVKKSGLLKSARLGKPASLERHDDFYDALGLESSADGCRLCSLLWDSYLGPRENRTSGTIGLEIKPISSSEAGQRRLSLRLYNRGSGEVTGKPLVASRDHSKNFLCARCPSGANRGLRE